MIYQLFNVGFGSTPSGAQLRDLVDDAEWLATLLHQAHAEAAGDGPAAIVACHAEAERWADTDWAQFVPLYGMLQHLAPSPCHPSVPGHFPVTPRGDSPP